MKKKLEKESHPLTLPKHRRSGGSVCHANPNDNGTNPEDGLHDATPFGIDFSQYFNSLPGNPRRTPTTILYPAQELETISTTCVTRKGISCKRSK